MAIVRFEMILSNHLKEFNFGNSLSTIGYERGLQKLRGRSDAMIAEEKVVIELMLFGLLSELFLNEGKSVLDEMGVGWQLDESI